MREVDALTVSVLVDNTTDMLSSRPAHVTSELRVLIEAGMGTLAGEALCSAHHGLSLLIVAHVDGRERTVLFDAGPDPYAIARNSTRMGVDLGRVEAVVLSHGHFDHAEGLLEAADLIRARNGGRQVPLHHHPGVFGRRAIRLATGDLIPLQDVPAPAALRDHGYVLVDGDRPEDILDGTLLLSGEVPRHSFERGMANQVRLTASGGWEPDPLVQDERFMLAHVRGKGLVIVTGCSHAGVVNVCRHARALVPDTPLYALIGGLRLVYPNEDLIDATIAELTSLELGLIMPGHCTGWKAVHALVSALGPLKVDPLAVGMRYSLWPGAEPPLRIPAYTALALVAFAANSILCRLALRDGTIDAATFSTIRLVSGAVTLLLLVRRAQGSWTSAALLALYAIPFSFAYNDLSAGTGALILFGSV